MLEHGYFFPLRVWKVGARNQSFFCSLFRAEDQVLSFLDHVLANEDHDERNSIKKKDSGYGSQGHLKLEVCLLWDYKLSTCILSLHLERFQIFCLKKQNFLLFRSSRYRLRSSRTQLFLSQVASVFDLFEFRDVKK